MNINQFLDRSDFLRSPRNSQLENFQVTTKDKLKLTIVRSDSLGRESEFQFNLSELTLSGQDVRNPRVITTFRVNLD